MYLAKDSYRGFLNHLYDLASTIQFQETQLTKSNGILNPFASKDLSTSLNLFAHFFEKYFHFWMSFHL